MSWQHWVMVVGLIIGGSSIFNIFSFFGQRMLRHEEEKERKLEEERVAHMQNSLQQVLIPSTFYEQLFKRKVFCAAFF
jgi:hypothetical protein